MTKTQYKATFFYNDVQVKVIERTNKKHLMSAVLKYTCNQVQEWDEIIIKKERRE